MPTIRDVALRAGVSKATVSYVINGRSAAMRIPEETQERILCAVREIGYHPNALARGLAHKRTETVAIVMQFPTLFLGWSGFTQELMRGVTNAAVRHGFDVLLHTRQARHAEGADEAECLNAEVAVLTDGRVDGALLLRDMNDGLASRLHARRFPAVLMYTRATDPDLWFVDCDNVCGGSLAVEHLLGLGRRRIVHLAGHARSSAGIDRRVGYERAMRAAGIEPEPGWVVEAPHPQSDFGPVLKLFDAPPEKRPDAVFAWSDDVAITVMGMLRERGLRIPEDVAIVGYDSTALCNYTNPPLTSIRQPIDLMAERALSLLADQIAGSIPAESRVLAAPALMVRGSCGGAA